MTRPSAFDRLVTYFWPDGDLPSTPQVYALLDGAVDRRIEPMIRLSRLEYVCLYGGHLSAPLRAAAPYLVHLTPGQFVRDLIAMGWGRSWGVFTITPPDVTMQQQRRHFKTLLRVEDERGRALVFRFYDPRVFRIYVPTCTPAETTCLFGPIPTIALESADGSELVVHTHEQGRIGTSRVTVAGAIPIGR